MKYKAVLFDLDGTLLDSVDVILKSSRETFAAMGLPYDEDSVRKSIGLPLEVQAGMWAGTRVAEFLKCYRAIYKANDAENSRFFPGTEEMLNAISASGHRIGLVTSKISRSAHRTLARVGVEDKFEVVVTCDDVAEPKPHPEPIFKALDLLRLAPSEAVFVGDSMFDVDCAQRAGVDMVAVSWGARTREDLLLQCPDGVFDTWQAFLGWLGNYPECSNLQLLASNRAALSP